MAQNPFFQLVNSYRNLSRASPRAGAGLSPNANPRQIHTSQRTQSLISVKSTTPTSSMANNMPKTARPRGSPAHAARTARRSATKVTLPKAKAPTAPYSHTTSKGRQCTHGMPDVGSDSPRHVHPFRTSRR